MLDLKKGENYIIVRFSLNKMYSCNVYSLKIIVYFDNIFTIFAGKSESNLLWNTGKSEKQV